MIGNKVINKKYYECRVAICTFNGKKECEMKTSYVVLADDTEEASAKALSYIPSAVRVITVRETKIAEVSVSEKTDAGEVSVVGQFFIGRATREVVDKNGLMHSVTSDYLMQADTIETALRDMRRLVGTSEIKGLKRTTYQGFIF